MKRALTITAALLTAATLLAGTAQAAGPGHCDRSGFGPLSAGLHHGGHKGIAGLERLEARLERVNLSDEQRAQVRAVIDAARPGFRKVADSLRAHRKEMRGVMRSDAYDEGAVRRVADRQGELVAEMIVLRSKVKSQVAAVLTEEQRQELRKGSGRQHHGPKGPGAQRPEA